MTAPTTSELLARIRGIEMAVIGRIEGLLQGDHGGLLPGPGGEPGDARPYVPGDDVRRIDWNVSARAQRPHVRDTTADRELETTLVVDVSGSMSFGSGSSSKADVAMGAAAVFGFLTDRAGDRVGAVIVGNGAIRNVAAESGRAHVYAILGLLGADAVGGEGDLAAGLMRVARLKRRRGLVVVISDFVDGTDWRRPLRSLSQKHDVVAVEVFDPREFELADVGMVKMVDPETGSVAWVDTGSRTTRESFAEGAQRRLGSMTSEMAAAGVSHIRLACTADWATQLVSEVLARRRTVAATGRS